MTSQPATNDDRNSHKTNAISRREALVTASSAIAVASAALRPAAAATQPSASGESWIDAHSHIWTPDTSQFALAPGMTVDDLAPRSFTADELMAVAQPNGVERVVLIQHTPFHGFDNSYLINAWRQQPDRFRIVGMIDDLRPKCGQAMKQFLKQGVTGFRILPRKGIRHWLQTDGMKEMWRTAAETRQSMCCLINPEQLPEVDNACWRNPDTPVVIDHFARIGIDGEIREADLNQLVRLARHPHVKVKISAYYALGNKRPPHDELIPMIRRLYETFGPQRLMWASDCPYQLSGPNTYESSIRLIKQTIDFVTEEERRRLLRTTAEETFFYV
ncbi:MAG: hypothetical protein Fues2KO_02850 [Fuerstiella sp.]